MPRSLRSPPSQDCTCGSSKAVARSTCVTRAPGPSTCSMSAARRSSPCFSPRFWTGSIAPRVPPRRRVACPPNSPWPRRRRGRRRKTPPRSPQGVRRPAQGEAGRLENRRRSGPLPPSAPRWQPPQVVLGRPAQPDGPRQDPQERQRHPLRRPGHRLRPPGRSGVHAFLRRARGVRRSRRIRLHRRGIPGRAHQQNEVVAPGHPGSQGRSSNAPSVRRIVPSPHKSPRSGLPPAAGGFLVRPSFGRPNDPGCAPARSSIRVTT